MSEVLRLVKDLEVMSNHLNIGILKHHYNSYSPATSRPLRESINHFYMKELEASDYRSAYHLFCDWLYGWNVTDSSDMVETSDYLKMDRTPRDIQMSMERERQDCARLMGTFETLTGLSRRQLKKLYAEVESEIPRLGQGIETLSVSMKQEEPQNNEKLWATEQKDTLQLIPELTDEEQRELEDDFQEAPAEIPDVTEATLNETSMTLSFIPRNRRDSSFGRSSIGGNVDHQTAMAEAARNQMERKSVVGANVNRGSFSFIPGKGQEDGSSTSARTLDMQRDIDHVYIQLDVIAEYTLISLLTISVVIACSELLGDKQQFTKACSLAHELSMDFISNTLKTNWILLNLEIPDQMSFSVLRETKRLGEALGTIIGLRNLPHGAPKLRMRKLHYKYATIHDLLRLVDVNLLPSFIPAHTEGVKCAKFSSFDSFLWMTGGYDCIIRISDIRASNNHICLAQYVGHKSIVSDVHFSKNDTHIVSSSFDRTVIIWNSQTAVAEKVLNGHVDAILSCDISPDNRYIASGSMDNTARLWDFMTGECISVIKKHTRWIKVVKFTPDGRFLITAGMDKKIYLWDLKILINSKSPTHSRTFDSFNDYVLDLAVTRPTLMLATCRDSTIHLFDYMSGHELQVVSLGPSWACTICFSENGEYFATGSFDNNVNIFRTRDFVKIRQIRVFNLGILCVQFPIDQSYLAVGTSEGFLQQIVL